MKTIREIRSYGGPAAHLAASPRPTRTLVRDLDKAGICRRGGERDLAQRLVALAKENYENLTRS